MIPQGQQTESATHESRDADVMGLAMVAGLLFVLIALSLLVCGGALHLFNRSHRVNSISGEAMVARKGFPEPRLLIHPGAERAKSDHVAKGTLETYGWINREGKIVHIPISRAMELLVERGLPEVGAGQTRLQLMQSRPKTDVQPEKPISSSAPEEWP